MNAPLACALAAALAGDAIVAPRQATWEECGRDVFDPRWILPSDLALAKVGEDGEREPAVVLANEMRRLAALVVEPSKIDPKAPRSLGDVVRAVRTAKSGAPAIDAVLTRVAETQAGLWSEIEPWAREILCDEKLRAKRWDPDDDDACDGIAFARPLTRASRKDDWSKFKGSDLLQQAVAFIAADLEAIKAAENDFPKYVGRPGTKYEEIFAYDKSYVRGIDPGGHGFAAVRTHFRCDLPFPFSDYSCDMSILNRIDEHGDCVSDVYSPSKDFLWLAGRDVLIPLETSAGEWVGTLLVRTFGFDLKGVPDGDDDRRMAVRSSLGCLKRESEALFKNYGGSPRTTKGKVPEFEVHGRR